MTHDRLALYGLGALTLYLVTRPSQAARRPDIAIPRVPSAYAYEALRADYAARYERARIVPSRTAALDAIAARQLEARARYETVAEQLGETPWYLVAILHELEASGRWTAHLHNGDPLTSRTMHTPAGRPVRGEPPFTWEASAFDALSGRGFAAVSAPDWTIARILWECERYNGWGYRARHVPSPYLWSYTDQYTRGKFTSDGVYDPAAVSAQAGAAAQLLTLYAHGVSRPALE